MDIGLWIYSARRVPNLSEASLKSLPSNIMDLALLHHYVNLGIDLLLHCVRGIVRIIWERNFGNGAGAGGNRTGGPPSHTRRRTGGVRPGVDQVRMRPSVSRQRHG